MRRCANKRQGCRAGRGVEGKDEGRKKKKKKKEMEERKKKFYREVFRRSSRKKMGKVFICGLPLRSGPMAALNRSQLRGVGSSRSSRGVAGSRPERRTTC